MKFPDGFCFYTIVQTYLRKVRVNEQGQQVGEYIELQNRHYPRLAYEWRVWWILTKKGKEVYHSEKGKEE
jgi:hypothetical protein